MTEPDNDQNNSANDVPKNSSNDGLDFLKRVSTANPGGSITVEDFVIEIDAVNGHESGLDRGAHQILARFFAFCVLLVGIMTLLPVFYLWLATINPQWLAIDSGAIELTARWAFILGLVGGMHVIYFLYLIHWPDYSAVQMVAGFLLLMTCLYGFAATTMWLDSGDQWVARILQLPIVIRSRAIIWCGIMFGVSALICFVLGREAFAWRRRHLVRSNANR